MKRIARRTIRRFGYDIVRIPRIPEAQGHETVRPTASFAPWTLDRDFTESFAAIRDSTLLDVYRCYELWSLVDGVRSVPGCIVEVGVWRGGSGALLARRCRLSGIGDTVYLCDTFTGIVKATPDDAGYRGSEHADTSLEHVKALLASLDLHNTKILKGVFPDETAAAISGSAVRLCHVDVDVEACARDVFTWVWPRLSSGGVVVFDDYGFVSCPGVTRYVEQLARRPDLLRIYNLNGHAIVIKR